MCFSLTAHVGEKCGVVLQNHAVVMIVDRLALPTHNWMVNGSELPQ